MRNMIKDVTITGPHTVRVVYKDDEIREVDFQPIIEKGGVFAPMSDPEFFSQVRASDDGRYITWPGELDFCADAIRSGQRSPIRA